MILYLKSIKIEISSYVYMVYDNQMPSFKEVSNSYKELMYSF